MSTLRHRAVHEPAAIRGTGRTTQLLRTAPRGAMVVTLAVEHARSLALSLGRTDLRIVGTHALDSARDSWRGAAFQVLVDHGIAISSDEMSMIAAHNARISS